MAQLDTIKTDDYEYAIPMIIKILQRTSEESPLLSDRIILFMNNKQTEIGMKNKMNPPRLRKIVNYIRTNGIIPVISGSNGYYVSYDQEVIDNMVLSLESRIIAMQHAVVGLQNIRSQVKSKKIRMRNEEKAIDHEMESILAGLTITENFNEDDYFKLTYEQSRNLK